MHILTHPPVAVPSITEAFAGGKIDLVSDTGLIRALLAVEQNEDRLRTGIDGMNLHRVDLSQEYPELITIVRARSDSGGSDTDRVFSGTSSVAARCHFLEKPRNPAFLSHVVRGLGINGAYLDFLKIHLEHLDALAASLGDAHDPGSDGSGTAQ